jgi:uncharacterized protein (TIGR03000 family)
MPAYAGTVLSSGDATAAVAPSNRATIVVTLPADAKLTIDGQPTTSTSSTRRFSSPALEPGKTYYYTLKAEVVADGKPEVITEHVTVQANRETRVNLPLPVATARAR